MVKYNFPHDSIRHSSGIIISWSKKYLVLCHNFRETSPIDTTKILAENILDLKEILPKEIDYPDDIS